MGAWERETEYRREMAGRVREPEEETVKISPFWNFCVCFLQPVSLAGTKLTFNLQILHHCDIRGGLARVADKVNKLTTALPKDMSGHFMFQIACQFGRSHAILLKKSQSCVRVAVQLAQAGQHYSAVPVACLSFRLLQSIECSFCLLKYNFIRDIFLNLEISHLPLSLLIIMTTQHLQNFTIF